MKRLTIICPQALIADANDLAQAVGYGEAEKNTYRNPQWQDADGNLYACASLMVTDAFIANATTTLERPEWDADKDVSMAAAKRAQAKLVIWGLGEDEDAPVASPDRITALFHDEPLTALALAGIERVEEKL